MNDYDRIKLSITWEIHKCKATGPAKALGMTGVWKEIVDDEDYYIDRLEYEDGTYLEFGEDYALLDYRCMIPGHELTPKNHEIDFIEEGRRKIMDEYGKEGLLFYTDYTHFKMSYFGVMFNNYRRGLMTLDQFYEKMDWYIEGFDTVSPTGFTKGMNGREIADFLITNNPRYEEMCGSLDLNGFGDFITLRRTNRLYPNDNIDKRIVKDKGYSSNTTEYNNLDMIDSALHINGEEGWLIITNYHDGNPANHGMHLGYGEYMNMGSRDWGEVLNPPDQKMMRLLMDTKNHIIIQEPYEP